MPVRLKTFPPKLALGAGPAPNRFLLDLYLLCNLQGPVMEAGSRPVPLLLPSLCRPPNNERLRNQRPTLVVPPDVSTIVKEIWIGNVLLLETFLVKFLPAPKPFQCKDALGWDWRFLYIYLQDPSTILNGEGIFRFGNLMQSRVGILL